MLFTSGSFVLLVLITLGVFYLPACKPWQTPILILSSLVFYSLNQIVYLPLLLFSIGFNAFASQAIYFRKDLRSARRLAVLSVVVNLGLLFLFKYISLVARSLPNALTDEAGPAHFLLTIYWLPVGISFFTFEGISLIVDTYKTRDAESFFGTDHGRTRLAHLSSTTLFISFFPHLVAGPILKAHDFYPQIMPKHWRDVDWAFCFRKLVLGYFLKMVIADGLKEYTLWMAYPYFQNIPGLDLAVMAFGFSIQIFADFAGYSLIAIGVAAMFGYRLPENFDFPYISRSFAEFWQRWHISLSSWLREYLYFPLGGNRRGKFRTYLNLFLVMFLGGLWHGAAWSYAIWGTVHGLALAIERFFSAGKSKRDANRRPPMIVGALQMAFVFFVVTSAWLLFKFPELWQAWIYVKCIFINPWRSDFSPRVFAILMFCVPVLLYHAWYLLRQLPECKPMSWKPLVWTGRYFQPASYGVMLFLILVNSANSGDFIYFQF